MSRRSQDFSSVEPDELLEVLDNYGCRRRVSINTLQDILKDVSLKELGQKPMFVVDYWKDIIKLWISLNYEQLTMM